MALGDGILWSTVLILLSAGIYFLSVKKKWKSFGKVLGILILIGVVVGGVAAGVNWFSNRPVLVTDLDGIEIGMAPVDVSLLKGKPLNSDSQFASPSTREDWHEYRMIWTYRPGISDEARRFVVFVGDSPDSMMVSRVCQSGGYQPVLGLGNRSSEASVRKKLGEPTHISINEDGLSKYISYSQYKVTYEITSGTVSEVCVTSSGKLTYADEYGEETDLESP